MAFAPKGTSIEYIMDKYYENAEEGYERAELVFCSNDNDVVADTLEELLKQYQLEKGHPLEKGDYHCYNSNGKWDWYQLGGRWADFFKTVENPSNFAKQGIRSWASPSPKEGNWVDMGLISDIDWMGMMRDYLERVTLPMESLWKLFVDLPKLKSPNDIAEELTAKGWDVDGKIVNEHFEKQDRIKVLKDLAQESDVIRSLLYELCDNITFPWEVLNYPIEEALELVAPKAFETHALIVNDEWYSDYDCGCVEELPKKTVGLNIAHIVDTAYKEGKENDIVVYLVDYHY